MLKDTNFFPKQSLEIYEKLKNADENGQLDETTAEIFSEANANNINLVTIWRCREYLCKLSDEILKERPHLLCYRILIESMRGNLKKCDLLLQKYGPEFETLELTKLDRVALYRLMAELVMPQYSNEDFFIRARFLAKVASATGMSFNSLVLTACRPNVFNGFRDFSDICLEMENKRNEIQKGIELLYGNVGKGVYEVAHAEWCYEHGDSFGALVEVAGTIPILEHEKDTRCLFAAYVLQIRILVLNGQTKAALSLFGNIRNRMYETGSEEFEESLQAVMCHYYCYMGELAQVEKWLYSEAPDENDDLCMMDMYSYLIKMRCYIQTGQYMMTVVLGKKLLELLKPAYRPHDKCECHILIAMACYKAGDEQRAIEEFEQALLIANEYRYVRLFADEGQMMLVLLRVYKMNRKDSPIDDKYIREIQNNAMDVAKRFPMYLHTETQDEITLTKTEKRVLELISEGLSNEDIGKALDKKEGTIKCHTANIYKKFGVANRQQAINFAKDNGIIS